MEINYLKKIIVHVKTPFFTFASQKHIIRPNVHFTDSGNILIKKQLPIKNTKLTRVIQNSPLLFDETVYLDGW